MNLSCHFSLVLDCNSLIKFMFNQVFAVNPTSGRLCHIISSDWDIFISTESLAEPEWLRWLEFTLCHVLSPRFESHQYLHGIKRLSWTAGHQEVSRCCTRGEFKESVAHRWGSTQVRDPPGFETQGRHHQKSKTGIWEDWPKGLMSSKTFIKNHKINVIILPHDSTCRFCSFCL